MPLYEIVLRRKGFADETRLTDHAGFSIGDSIQVGGYDCLVTSIDERSKNLLVTQRVICTLALGVPPRPQKLLGEALDRYQAAAFVFDARGELAVVNQAAARMTGYSPLELAGMDSATLVPEPATAGARVAAVVAGALRSGESAIRRRDGTMIAVRFCVDVTTVAGQRYYLSLCWPLA
jgi:PAS domain S-box-containing protein